MTMFSEVHMLWSAHHRECGGNGESGARMADLDCLCNYIIVVSGPLLDI